MNSPGSAGANASVETQRTVVTGRQRGAFVVKCREISTCGLTVVLAMLVTVGLTASSAMAEAESAFELEVVVVNLTGDHSGIDKGAERLHKELKSQFRYEGIRVLQTKQLNLSVNDVHDMKLPTLRRLRLRPLVIEEGSTLISVEISGLVQSDLRLAKGQLIIIGAEKYGNGRLVIALQSHR